MSTDQKKIHQDDSVNAVNTVKTPRLDSFDCNKVNTVNTVTPTKVRNEVALTEGNKCEHKMMSDNSELGVILVLSVIGGILISKYLL